MAELGSKFWQRAVIIILWRNRGQFQNWDINLSVWLQNPYFWPTPLYPMREGSFLECFLRRCERGLLSKCAVSACQLFAIAVPDSCSVFWLLGWEKRWSTEKLDSRSPYVLPLCHFSRAGHCFSAPKPIPSLPALCPGDFGSNSWALILPLGETLPLASWSSFTLFSLPGSVQET